MSDSSEKKYFWKDTRKFSFENSSGIAERRYFRRLCVIKQEAHSVAFVSVRES